MGSINPILDHIAQGGHNVTLDALQCGDDLRDEERLFRSTSLNRSILFKFPMNARGIAYDDPDQDENFGLEERPLDTAVYVPDDEKNKYGGGFAIYLRQRGFLRLLQNHVGIGLDLASEASVHDLRVLTLIDRLPSLDPFLLKSQCDIEGVPLHESYVAIAPSDEKRIRERLARRLRPIVQKAMPEGCERSTNESVERFLDAIWSPWLPEASLLMSAFKIQSHQANAVFTGWKGIGYYEFQFERSSRVIARFIRWLNTRDSEPVDMIGGSLGWEQLKMHKQRTSIQLRRLIMVIRKHLDEYEEAYDYFIDREDPLPLRRFLGSAYSRYWDFGFCINALHHIAAVYNRLTDRGTKTSLRFEEVSHIVTIADLATRHPDYDELEVWGERDPAFRPANSDIRPTSIAMSA